MQKFFFAGCCLRVLDKNDFLLDSPLSFFESELPYSCDAVLEVSIGVLPKYNGPTFIYEGKGIRVAGIGEGKWLFLSEDKENPCSIEAEDGYSFLKGYAAADCCGDIGELRKNFFELLRLAVECRMALHNGVAIHASCVRVNNQAVLFAAPSGAGKSTQAALWKKHLGAGILSGDRPLLNVHQQEVRVHGVPWDGKEQIFLQEDWPVAAIVEVRKASRHCVRRLSPNQAFRLLAKQCFIPMWDDAAKFSVMRMMRQIAKSVPCYRFFCLPDAGGVELLGGILFDGQRDRLKREQPDMKIKEGFILKNVMDEWVVMPAGSNIKNFEGAIVLNEVAAFVWRQLEVSVSREDLLCAVLQEYDTDEKTAGADLDVILGQIRELGILQES